MHRGRAGRISQERRDQSERGSGRAVAARKIFFVRRMTIHTHTHAHVCTRSNPPSMSHAPAMFRAAHARVQQL